MSAEAEIRPVLEARIDAMRRKDAAAAVALLAPDIAAFELAPPLALRGPAARDEAGLNAWFEIWEGGVEIELRDLVIETGGDIAFAHSLNRLSGTRKDGVAVDFWMRSTLGFRRIDGAWKISHGHSSVPFYMDGSYRAARDLQP
jgi:ketosteroid isomerase-like protein